MRLDKQSKTVLKACIKSLSDPNSLYWSDLRNTLHGVSDDDIVDSLKYLKSQKLVNYDDDPILGIHLIWLSYEGLHYYDFLKVDFKKYLADKWISIIALIISIIALFISALSITR
ncbi:MAG: hypothetical protein ACLTDX_15000 [[Clostridium] innocuum]